MAEYAPESQARLVAVFASEDDVRTASRALQQAGIDPSRVTVDRGADHLSSVGSEMREEINETVMGPGSVGPFTRNMSRGMFTGSFVGAVIGLVLALPFAAFSFGGWPVWGRLLVVAVVGIALGGTAGWVLGGGFGADREDETLTAEHGITLGVPASDSAEGVLRAAHPLRVDLVAANGKPLATVMTRKEPIARTLGRHLADEARHD
jgi:hypothetical protein